MVCLLRSGRRLIKSTQGMRHEDMPTEKAESRDCDRRGMTMKKYAVAASTALAVCLWSTVGRSQTTLVCEGEYRLYKDCASGGVFIQGVRVDGRDCTNTCENHGYVRQTGCYTLDSYAKKLCGNKTAVRTQAFPPAAGNKCGYGWWFITCQ